MTPDDAAFDPCSQRIANWQTMQRAIKAASAADRLTQLRAAAARIGSDPEGCTVDLVQDAIDTELRRVLVLKIAEKVYPAAVVYSCDELSDGTTCSSRDADDTVHLGEGWPDGTPTIPASADVQTVATPDYPLESLQWYRALGESLMQDEPSVVVLLPRATGVLRLPKAEKSNVLFAIARSPSGELHKWVWLIKDAPAPAVAAPDTATANNRPAPSR